MSNYGWKTVTTRKDHTCGFCQKTIKAGEQAQYYSCRQARHDERDLQIGIEYVRGYLHHIDNPECVIDGARPISEPENALHEQDRNNDR